MNRNQRRGITLLEVLVVIAIANVLMLLVLPAIQNAREAARRLTCANNLRQIGVALHNYHEHHGTFPIANLPFRHWSWQAAVLPFLEQHPIYDLINYHSAFVECFNTLRHEGETGTPSAGNTTIALFTCPSDPKAGIAAGSGPLLRYQVMISYLGVSGSRVDMVRKCWSPGPNRDGMLFAHQATIEYPKCNEFYYPVPTCIRHVTDGTAKTLMAGERGVPPPDWLGNHRFGWLLCGLGTDAAGEADHVLSVGWGFQYPGRDEDDVRAAHRYWSHHPGGAHFLYVDGSVHFLDYAISLSTLQTLATRGAGD